MNIGDRVHGHLNNVALIFVSSDRVVYKYTYCQLETLIDEYRGYLRCLGLERGLSLGILADNSDSFIIAWYAALREGLTVVPINNKLSNVSIAHILNDANIVKVLIDENHLEKLPTDFSWAPLSKPDTHNQPISKQPSVKMSGDDRAVVLYTSGSTGAPKGVPMTHAGYGWTIDTRLKGGPYSHHRLLVAAPLYHINALGSVTFALAAGASVVLLQRFEAPLYIRSIDQYLCTWITSVPTMLAMVLRETDELKNVNFNSVRLVRMGSSPVSERLFQQVRDLFGDEAIISNAYGTTEGGPLVFGKSVDGKSPPIGAAGWPLPDVKAKLVDADGYEVEDQGELVYKTPATMTAYLNLPEKTRQVLSEDGWYASGDIFRRDKEGAFWFISRTDDMFVCGGENIHPQEVERILEDHPSVQQACVVPVPDEIKGSKPVAFVVIRENMHVTEDELREYALASGPAYQHPRRVFFLELLPLAGTNKIDRKQLMSKAKELFT